MTKRAASWAMVLGTCMCSSLGSAAPAHAQAAASTDAATAEAAADPAQAEAMARQHFSLGRTQYDAGAFSDAASSFEQAYALSKREVLWYNIYLAHRDAGNNEQAAIALRNYLERVPELENRSQLEARLQSLERIVTEEKQRERDAADRAVADQQRQAAADVQAQQDTSAAVTAAEHDPGEKPEPSRSIVPYVLMGMGGAMVVGGAVTGAMASSKHSELEEKCGKGPCDASLKGLADEGKTLALTADILLFGGIAAAVGGGVWWLLDSSSDGGAERPVRAALSCGPRACNGSVAVTF